MNQSKKHYTVVTAILMALILEGCAYRFANRSRRTPRGIKHIAVEAVYDTGREVLPREALWLSLQQAIATDGHLTLTAAKDADALLRIHLKSARVDATGSDLQNDLSSSNTKKDKDPKAFSYGPPPLPQEFRNLTQTGQYRDKGTISAIVGVELIHLSTRKVVLKKDYPISPQFQALHAASGITTTENDYLRYDEASRASFKSASDNLARQVLSDILIR